MMDVETTLHFQRARDRLSMTCPVMFAGVPSIGEGYLLNLSPAGCTVECERSVLDGSYMKLRLLLPDHVPSIDVDLAAVRWVRGTHFGVEFLRLPAQERLRLDRFLLDHHV
ncbi:MAG: PilZ domain-containing protein [Nitrospiraceae bacterium]